MKKIVSEGLIEKNGKYLLVKENLQIDGEEISDIGWFSYEEIVNMKSDLRADGYFINTIKNKIENKISPIELIRIEDK